ncbi:MAG: ABC transporter ATP-binding protein/permease [Clostridia bacterium]|nr:ABC transporter ATP-binding protein/permease [Clostridia bacterium]
MGEVKKLWRIAAVYPIKFLLLIIEGCIVSLMLMGAGLIYGLLVNMVADGKQLNEILLYCGLSVAYIIVACLMRWHNRYLLDKYASDVIAHYRNAYVDALFNAPYGKITEDGSARYLNNLDSDIERVSNTIVYNMYYSAVNCVTVIGSFVTVLTLNYKILLAMLGFVAAMAILPLFIKKRLDNSILQVSEKKKSYVGVLKEYLLGIATVKNFCAEENAVKIIDAKNKQLNLSMRRNAKIDGVAGGLGCLMRELAVVSLIALTCYFVYTGEVAIGSVLTVFSVGNAFFNGILSVSAVITYLFSVGSLRDTVFGIVDLDKVKRSKDMRYNDEIVIKDVCFSYPSRPEPILKGLSVTLKKNNKYLILGKSGSGKSTLLKLLSAEYSPSSGEMTVDGVPYREYTEKDVNATVSVSRQSGYIFNRSLRDNIDFLSDGDEIKLQNTINRCKLNEFMQRLPDGADTVLDEELNQVSGGEKLRINLARALYRDSDILLLDEVTSALDKSTSEDVENALLHIPDKTVVNVCHKFNDETLPLYDSIYIIEDGRVVLSGNFEQIKDSKLLAAYRNVPSGEEAV